jgi:LmbE family N-acetylglucosaminyl deacetylase
MTADGPRRANALVIAAHPDDEVLGCGGTVALHTRRNERVVAVIACESVSLRYRDKPVDMDRQMHEAAAVLQIGRVVQLELPDQRLDTFSLTDLIMRLEEVVSEVQPRVVYCQYGGDANRDHQLLFKAALIATRPMAESIEAILAYSTLSSTEWGYPRSFVPDTWVDISATLDQKLAAMACYQSELRDFPHPRSLRAIRSKAEAEGSACCLEAAEPFMTVRRISRRGQTPG